MSEGANNQLRQIFERLGLSMRARDKILKAARTVADPAGSETVEAGHVAEASFYRSPDKKYRSR